MREVFPANLLANVLANKQYNYGTIYKPKQQNLKRYKLVAMT